MTRYQPYPRYAPSDVEWLGEIPDGWEELRLKFVGDAIIGLTYDPDDLTDEQGGTLVLRANNIQDRKLVGDDPVFVDVDAPERLRTRGGDILICSRNGSRHLIGKNAQVKGAFVGCYFGAFNTVFRSPVNDFLFHVFNSSLFEFQSGSYLTSTINQLTLGALNSFVVPLPPETEQQQIAAFLEWKTSQIDVLIARKQELLEKLVEKRLAVITHAVTRGVDRSAYLRDSGIPWIGQVPRHWEVKRLKFSVTKVGSGVTPKGGSESYEREGIPLLRSQNVHFDGLRLNDIVFISEETHQDMSNSQVATGDVLLNITGASIGRCNYVPGNFGEGNVNQHVCIIRPEARLRTRYLQLVLWSKVGESQIDLEQSGSGREGLTFVAIKNFVIPLPDTNEQDQIVEHVEQNLGRLEALIEKAEDVVARLTEYRTALITAATTGKIDVRTVKIPETLA